MKTTKNTRGPKPNTNPIYVFDITNAVIHKHNGPVSDFYDSDFYKKWFPKLSYDHLRTSFSGKKAQHCLYSRFYISRDPNFKINYYTQKTDHNPLRFSHGIASWDLIEKLGEGFLTHNYNELVPTFESINDPLEHNYYERRFFKTKDIKDRFEWD